jgi:hypothetical protein
MATAGGIQARDRGLFLDAQAATTPQDPAEQASSTGGGGQTGADAGGGALEDASPADAPEMPSGCDGGACPPTPCQPGSVICSGKIRRICRADGLYDDMPCPEPALGIATCSAGSCGFDCQPGYHACGMACVSGCCTDGECGPEGRCTRESCTIPLKLFWSPARGDNFTTGTAQGAQDAMAAGYSYARIEGYALKDVGTNTVPLKLYWSAERGDNFTTGTIAGEADALAAGYSFARVEGHAYAEQVLGTVPLKLFWSPARGDNFSTCTATGETDALAAGYVYVRVEGFVYPAVGP